MKKHVNYVIVAPDVFWALWSRGVLVIKPFLSKH